MLDAYVVNVFDEVAGSELAVANAYRDRVVADGGANLLLYLPLDANYGLTDQSGNGRNGTAVGGVTIGAIAGPGDGLPWATDFDGVDDRVTTTYNPFTNATIRTYEGWAWRDDTAAAHNLISSDVPANAPFLQLSSGSQNVLWKPDNAIAGVTWAAAWPGSAQWVHWMLVFDEGGDTAKLYINGSLVSSQAATSAYNATPGNSAIGARGTNNFFNGRQAHVAVYNTDKSSLAAAHAAAYPYAALSNNTSLTVLDLTDFNLDPEGGSLKVDDGTNNETITYTVPSGSTGSVTLGAGLTNSYLTGTKVSVLVNGTPITERWADLREPDGEELLRTLVPHQLRTLISTGPRDEDAGAAEHVRADMEDGDLVIQNVLAQQPALDGYFLDDDSVLGDAIASEQIVGRHILADDIMAQRIAAILLIAAQLKTADSGQRVEIDVNGIRWYDASGNLGIDMPTESGQPAVFNADVVASTLDVVGNMTMRSAGNKLEIGSGLTLQSSQSDPVVGPSVAVNYEQLALTGGIAPQGAGIGLDYASNGGAGGATPTFLVTEDVPGSASVLEEYDASTGAFIRMGPSFGDVRGICHATVGGSRKIFLLTHDLAVSAVWSLARYNASDLALEAVVGISAESPSPTDIPNTNPSSSAVLGLVGGNPTVLTFKSTSATAASVGRLLTYNGSTLTLTSTQDLSGRTYTPVSKQDRFAALVDDGTSIWVGVRNDPIYGNLNHRYNSVTFAYEANHDFTSAGVVGSRGLTWDGTRFWSRGAGGPPFLFKHTTWDWTTESAKYWIGYTWADATHETLVSPRTSQDLTNLRRARVRITVPTFPSGVTKAKVYVARNATAPATTALKLQAPTTYVDTDATVTINETDFNNAGAAPPTSNGFGTGTPATISGAPTAAGITTQSITGDGTFRPPKGTTANLATFTPGGGAGSIAYDTTLGLLVWWTGSSWTTGWQNWTPTFTGWSANPAGGVYRYMQTGKTVQLMIRQPNTGTSNATTKTISLPSGLPAATITNAIWSAPAAITDNGTVQVTSGRGVINSAGTTVAFGTDWGVGAFTNAGAAAIREFQVTYEAA